MRLKSIGAAVAMTLLFCIAAPAQQPSDIVITGREVSAVQVELSKRGLYDGKPSGVLDQRTREAVREWQKKNGIPTSGRIDRETYLSLGLTYPAKDSTGSPGLLPRIGGSVRDTTVATGQSIGGAAGKVRDGAVTGLEKTWDLGESAAGKSKEAASEVGGASVRGAKGLGKGAQRVSTRLIGRNDAEVGTEVRRLLDSRPETERWVAEVRDGMVTVKAPAGHKADLGQVISDIRKIAGVKTVFVVNL